MIKTKRNRKWKIPNTVLEKQTLCFSSYKNCKLKVKLMSWSSRKKIEVIFCTAYFVRRVFFKICVLSQCILYWIHFQNIQTFKYQKALLQTLLLLVCKIFESLRRILKDTYIILNVFDWDDWILRSFRIVQIHDFFFNIFFIDIMKNKSTPILVGTFD